MLTEYSPQFLGELVERHRVFWQRGQASQPLVSYTPARHWAPKPYPLRGGRIAYDPQCITAADIDVDLLIGQDKPLPPLLTGDLFNSLGCRYPEAWMESFIGCPIYASAFGCVSRPVVEDIDNALARFSIDDALQSPWLAVAESVMRRARVQAGDAYPVQQLHLRGVVDMLAAYLGESVLCMALYDAPEKVGALAERFTELFLRVAERVLPLRGLWQGGMVSEWSLYAPAGQLDYQVDASSLVSPELYRDYLLPFDRQVLGTYPCSLLHLHACGLQHLDTFATCPQVNAIEISGDRETGKWDQAGLLHAFQTVQQHGKPLLIHGEMTTAEYREFVDTLEPAGLAIACFGLDSAE